MISALATIAALSFSGSAAAAPGDAAGGLIQLPSPNDCVSDLAAVACGSTVNGGMGNAHGLAVALDGKNVYVASENGALSTFTRNPLTGALTFDRCVKDQTSTEACIANSPRPGDLAGAHSVGVSSDGKFVYVAASTGTTDSITVFSRDAVTGALTPLGTTGSDGKTDECISEVAAQGCRPVVAGLKDVSYLTVTDNSVYAVSRTNSTLVRLARDQASGRLTDPPECFRGTGSPELNCGSAETKGLKEASQVAVTPDGTNLYVVSRASSAVLAFTRNTTTGSLSSPICTRGNDPGSDCDPGDALGGLNGAQGIAVTNGNVYVASGTSNLAGAGHTLAVFTRNPATGGLTWSQCYRDPNSTGEAAQCVTGMVAGLKGAAAIAITNDGGFVYVAAAEGSDVAEFGRDTVNGKLTPLAGDDACAGGTSNSDCPPANHGRKGITGASSIVTGPSVSPDNVYVTGPTDHAVAEFRTERPPVCTNLSAATDENHPVTGTLVPKCVDPNGDPIGFSKVTNPANGSATVAASGRFTYTPNHGFRGGTDSFTYKANDGHLDSNIATVTVRVRRDVTAPHITLTDLPSHITRENLLSRGIKFTEVTDEKAAFGNELLGSARGLGFGRSTSYNIVVATKSFSFGGMRHRVTLKPSRSAIGRNEGFKLKVHVVATDGAGNRRGLTKTVRVL